MMSGHREVTKRNTAFHHKVIFELMNFSIKFTAVAPFLSEYTLNLVSLDHTSHVSRYKKSMYGPLGELILVLYKIAINRRYIYINFIKLILNFCKCVYEYFK